VKTRFVTSLILALGSASAAAQPSPAAPAQQVQPGAPSPAPAEPAAPAAPSGTIVNDAPVTAPPPVAAPAAPPAAGVKPVYVTPRGYVPPPQRYAAPPQQPYPPPPVMIPLHPYVAPRPRLPDPQPPPPRVYGNAGAPLALGVGGALLWRHEDHRRFGNDDPGGGVNAFVSYDVWAPSRAFVVAGGFDYRHDQRARTSLGQLKENLLTADLTARMRAASWLWPHLRAGVGLAVTHVELKDRAAAIEFDDRELGVAGSFGGGFTLRTPTRALETHRGQLSSLSFGVLVEGGYTLAKDATLTPEPSRGGDVRRASPASFSAERSAAYLRILAVIRF
jgi:hypothetical protein